ncbi:peptidoglycan/xylan/chitin deacetylase (PgdA/CDA1 family) [Clostridium saccharoperbutylacetonicum]|uniref:Putative xylanase/chitin deacetylase n=1 Tax=Clostridium saccharoperbutylacetonicum N1-4(HMT) TaxID=931276 RepID=M1N3E6_9CLOT|nr:polysaccharide deacetylase family protein [Clostridium saccharoperbutylacetonicum]AGF57982.1 putative xylanase/chitin deacetylase [Clostridium saccharoperbutylacetonicum N1-4(HMT)]NRT61245.1 peptidoglycan/xylan/chitin deacetylase (PgdA/CDA1 family) [Clostridium saccharoperbutylacetonicum]NSB24562.1 peptidoglycan/xylan/chitin deacetylase (PgdA/CDA1 family) [Clostridium saccharoperbutylacetonicum]NSB43937.1 peptidoglycan/xylan/chitin deacetylase (PgdA/CDA1 family) [Clostridium saccharoperbutyl
MDSTNIKRVRYNKRKRRRKRSKTNIGILVKLILCVAVIFTSIMISIDKQEKATLNMGLSEVNEQDENNNGDTTAEAGEKREDEIVWVNDNRGVPVICYHSITEDKTKKGPIVIPVENFKEQLKTIKDAGYITLTMAELNGYLYENKPIPEKSVIITFDDGYRDNYTLAFPILKELNMKATIFVISSFMNRSDCLSPEELKEMSDYGIDIESHTVSHKRLSDMNYKTQLKELKDSKVAIEKVTGKPVTAIAYPEGKYNDNTKKAVVEAGYAMGFTIERGYADRNDLSTRLNRICVDYTYKPNNILNVLKNLKK